MRLLWNSALGVLVLAAMAAAFAPKAVLADGRVQHIDGTFAVSYMAPAQPSDDSAVNYCARVGTPGGTPIEALGIGNISRPLGPLFLTIRKCRIGITYAGTFEMTAGNGDTLHGEYDGTHATDNVNAFGSFHGTLTVTGGTGRFHRAGGVLSFTAVGSPRSAGATPGTVNGAAYYLVQGNMLSHARH